jgi:hypothetical protein
VGVEDHFRFVLENGRRAGWGGTEKTAEAHLSTEQVRKPRGPYRRCTGAFAPQRAFVFPRRGW